MMRNGDEIKERPGRPLRVFVGLSGGVDSSVSAALLKERGFDVTGVFIKVWQPDWMECTWREDRLDAMRVSVRLGIPFVTLDLEKEYKKEVVDYMIEEYKAGRTPNPDVMCNRYVKFGGFFDWAMKNGADLVATGHYAQIRQQGDAYRLVSGADEGKDQSYFLWTLTQRQLSKTLFPVGGMRKSETRRLAKKFGLPVAKKKDSQGLCFIGKVDIKEFLSHYIEPKKGDVLDLKGAVIGEHPGALFFTEGERHGFTITEKSDDDAPYYVVSRDLENNTLTVSHTRAEGDKASARAIKLERTNFISGLPEEGVTYRARVRHLGELYPCAIEPTSGGKATVTFDSPLAVASGQSVVVYSDDVCIGGGIVI